MNCSNIAGLLSNFLTNVQYLVIFTDDVTRIRIDQILKTMHTALFLLGMVARGRIASLDCGGYCCYDCYYLRSVLLFSRIPVDNMHQRTTSKCQRRQFC